MITDRAKFSEAKPLREAIPFAKEIGTCSAALNGSFTLDTVVASALWISTLGIIGKKIQNVTVCDMAEQEEELEADLLDWSSTLPEVDVVTFPKEVAHIYKGDGCVVVHYRMASKNLIVKVA